MDFRNFGGPPFGEESSSLSLSMAPGRTGVSTSRADLVRAFVMFFVIGSDFLVISGEFPRGGVKLYAHDDKDDDKDNDDDEDYR